MPRALVLGADTAGLAGASNDASDISTWLTECGFVVDLRVGDAATRDGMLDGMRALAHDIDRDDTAVIYYSGHGGVLEAIDLSPARLGYLVPTDHEPGGRFRGILELEWSGLIAALTARTRNVAVIHDCCHAAHTVRGARSPRERVRALAPTRIRASELEAFMDMRCGGVVHPLGNPDVVRLTATSGHGLAWEHPNPRGRVQGLFTSMFLSETIVLRERPVTWAELGRRVRDRVLRANGRQRPEFEGPTHRRVFSLDTDDVPSIPVRSAGRRFVLAAGSVHGVERGDTFRATNSPGRTVVVTRPGLFESVVRIDTAPVDARTFEAVAAARATRYPIFVDVSDETVRSAIVTAIDVAPRLCVGDADTAIAQVRTEQHGLVVVDAHGPTYALLGHDADGMAHLVTHLSRLAGARALRRIAREFERSQELALAVERVGAASTWLDDDAEIRPTDRLCVHLTNHTRRLLWCTYSPSGSAPGSRRSAPYRPGSRSNRARPRSSVPSRASAASALCSPARPIAIGMLRDLLSWLPSRRRRLSIWPAQAPPISA